MTLVDLVVTLTGTTYSPIEITNANVLASARASGLLGSTYVYGVDVTVDSGVAMLSARILDRSRNRYEAGNEETPLQIDNSPLLTKEIRDTILHNTGKFRYSNTITSTKYTDSPTTE